MELPLLAQEMLFLAVVLVLPLMAAAVAGVVTVSLLGNMVGLVDPSIGSVARAIAVIAALLGIAGSVGARVVEFTGDTWGGLAGLGRGESSD